MSATDTRGQHHLRERRAMILVKAVLLAGVI